METNKKNIPEIRFPEFMNDGEWLSAPLYELIKTITPTNKLQTSEYKPSGKYPIIDQSQNYIVAYSDSAEALTNTGCSDTIVFGDHTCALKFVSFPFIQGADGIKIFKSKDNNKILTDYLYQYLSAFPIESKEYKRHFSELKETLIKFPSDAIEQKRIAECMESLERYTIQTKVKLEQLKAHKKGLMQKLFPAPGKSVPECRFKEFDNDGEWNSSTLKDIADVVQGYGFPERLQGKHVGKYPFIKVGDISYAYNQGDLSIKSASNYIDDKELIELKATAIKAGTTIFAKVGEAIKANKKVITSMECLIDNNVAGIKCKNNHNTDDLFLFYSMTRIDFTEFAGGVVPSIKKTTIEEITISIPNNITEQHRIAHSLSSVDKLINLYSSKLEELERHKQALRQRLFPTI